MEVNNRVKVCHMTSAHKRNDVRIFKKECISLSKCGYKVYLVVNDNLGDEIVDDVNIKSTGFVTNSRLQRIINSQHVIYEKALEIDAHIYHLHDPELLPIGYKLKKLGKKVIFDSHEFYVFQIKEKQYIPKLFRHLIAALYKTYETYVSKRIDAVIIPCTVEGVNVFERKSNKTVFINNVPKLEEFNQTGDKHKDNCVCYTGGLTHERGITNLVKACYRAKVKLILAGNITNEYRNQLEKMEEYSIVEYKGILNRKEIVDLYELSNIGMCTLLNLGQYKKVDNFATKVYEYMIMGLPVIISKSNYVENILREYEFGIAVDPNNIEEISDAITYLLNNPDVAKSLGENGKKAVLERYNWSVEEKKLYELYQILMENK